MHVWGSYVGGKGVGLEIGMCGGHAWAGMVWAWRCACVGGHA